MQSLSNLPPKRGVAAASVTFFFLSHPKPKKKQNRGLWACEKHTEIQNKAIGSTHFSFFTKTKKTNNKTMGGDGLDETSLFCFEIKKNKNRTAYPGSA